jgi:hypothetical protein
VPLSRHSAQVRKDYLHPVNQPAAGSGAPWTDCHAVQGEGMIEAITTLNDWIDNRAVIRRIVLFFTLYMTYFGTHEAWLFARTSTFDGVGTAAIIAAVLAPIAALQGFAFAQYSNSRK